MIPKEWLREESLDQVLERHILPLAERLERLCQAFFTGDDLSPEQDFERAKTRYIRSLARQGQSVASITLTLHTRPDDVRKLLF